MVSVFSVGNMRRSFARLTAWAAARSSGRWMRPARIPVTSFACISLIVGMLPIIGRAKPTRKTSSWRAWRLPRWKSLMRISPPDNSDRPERKPIIGQMRSGVTSSVVVWSKSWKRWWLSSQGGPIISMRPAATSSRKPSLFVWNTLKRSSLARAVSFASQ